MRNLYGYGIRSVVVSEERKPVDDKNVRLQGTRGFLLRWRQKRDSVQACSEDRRHTGLARRRVRAEDMNFPGSGLHQMKGDRKGEWAVKVSGNWRITFKFADGHAYDVNLEDYH
jgi:plasmid maintenance system killer protein